MSRCHEPTARIRRGVALAVVALLAAVVGACGGDDAADGDEGGGTTTVAADETTTTADPDGTSGTETTASPDPGTEPSDASGPTPTITSFTTPESIDCHNADEQTFTARWTTTDAVKVTISIDGPDVHDEYGPSGEASLPFSCARPHTFLLTATGEGGRTATETVTLQPRNAPPPEIADQEQ